MEPLDIGEVRQIATHVELPTATHPIDLDARRLGWECGQPITMADNGWVEAAWSARA